MGVTAYNLCSRVFSVLLTTLEYSGVLCFGTAQHALDLRHFRELDDAFHDARATTAAKATKFRCRGSECS